MYLHSTRKWQLPLQAGASFLIREKAASTLTDGLIRVAVAWRLQLRLRERPPLRATWQTDL